MIKKFGPLLLLLEILQFLKNQPSYRIWKTLPLGKSEVLGFLPQESKGILVWKSGLKKLLKVFIIKL